MGHVFDLRDAGAAEGRRQNGQCGVLGAADGDVAGKLVAAGYHEFWREFLEGKDGEMAGVVVLKGMGEWGYVVDDVY